MLRDNRAVFDFRYYKITGLKDSLILPLS